MQVNISFHGTAQAVSGSADNEVTNIKVMTFEDAGSAPALDGVDTTSFDAASGVPAQTGALVDIGAPPEWLYDAIAAHKAATSQESSTAETSSNEGEDGGAGPA